MVKKEDEQKTKLKAQAHEGKETPEEEKLEEKRCKGDVTEEDEDLKKEEEEAEEESEEEKKKKKAKKAKEDDEEDTEKGEAGGENPEEDSASGNDANSTISPNASVPSPKQHMMTPQSSVRVPREYPKNAMETVGPAEHSGNVPGYGKAAQMNLQKSPMFMELSKNIHEMQKALTTKLESVEKSCEDRIANLQKTISKVEEFYKKPLYKGFAENINPEAIQKESVKEDSVLNGGNNYGRTHGYTQSMLPSTGASR